MNYRLLIDYEALESLSQLKKPVQRMVHRRLKEIQDHPARWSDYQERDPTDRLLHVSICGGYAITF